MAIVSKWGCGCLEVTLPREWRSSRVLTTS